MAQPSSIATLASGASWIAVHVVGHATMADGAYHLVVIVDSGNAVYEGDETNNLAASASTLALVHPALEAAITSAPSSAASGETFEVDWTVTNTGARAGDEVVQLYIHDPVASISQPVRRLRGFERVTLEPGEARTVTFTLDRSDFGFYDNFGRFVVEPGQIDVYAGSSSNADLTQSFTVER